jgi:membrane protease YdiL (CAAX protease family)
VFLPFSLYVGGTHFSPTVDVCLNTFLRAFAVAVLEEVVFRGVLLHWLRRIAPAWVAIVVVSLVFMLWHVNGARDAIALLNVFVGGGVAFTIALLLSKSIWMPIGLHTGYDFWVMLADGTSVTGDGYIHFQSRTSEVVNTLLIASVLLFLGLVAWHFYLRQTSLQSKPIELSGAS